MSDDSRIPSPCIRHCCLDENDICLGCFRTIDEICAWAQANDEARMQILRTTAERRLGRIHNAVPTENTIGPKNSR